MTKTFTPLSYERALTAWSWVAINDKQVMFSSLFGDVFFDSPQGCWHLHRSTGHLTRLADNAEGLQALLETDAGQRDYLRSKQVDVAIGQGIELRGPEIFVVDPTTSDSNLRRYFAADFVDSMFLSGQALRQHRGKTLQAPQLAPTKTAKPQPRARFWRRPE